MYKTQQISTHLLLKLIFPGILISLLSACGGGGGSSSPAPTPEPETATDPEPVQQPEPEPEPTLTGIIVNGVVGGLRFETPTQSGLTNDSGEFVYLEGETVTFSIGDIALGSTLATAEVSPFDLVQSAPPVTESEMRAELNNNAVNGFDIIANISLFLVSLDNDKNPDNGLDLTGWDETLAGASLDFNENLYSFYDKTFKYFAIDHNANKHVKFSAPLIHLYENLGITIEANLPETIKTDLKNDGSIDSFIHNIYTTEGKPSTEFTDRNNDGNKEITSNYIFEEFEITNTESKETEFDDNSDGTNDRLNTTTLTFNKATGLLKIREEERDSGTLNSSVTKNTYLYDDERNLREDLFERDFDINDNASSSTKITNIYNDYDELEFQTTERNSNGSNVALVSKTYTYISPGKRKLITTANDNNGGVVPDSNRIETYTYDEEGNLEKYLLEHFSDADNNDYKIVHTYKPHANANPLTYVEDRDNDADGEMDARTSTTYTFNDSRNVLTELQEKDSDGNQIFESSFLITYSYDDNQFRKSEIIEVDGNADSVVDRRHTMTNTYNDNNTLKEQLLTTDENGDNIIDAPKEELVTIEYSIINSGLHYLLSSFKKQRETFVVEATSP